MKLEAATLKRMLHTNCNCFECNALKAGIDALTPQAGKARGEVTFWLAVRDGGVEFGQDLADAPWNATPQPQGDASLLPAFEAAWFAVCDALSEVDPDWMMHDKAGVDGAVAFIRKLGATPQVSGGGEALNVSVPRDALEMLLHKFERAGGPWAVAQKGVELGANSWASNVENSLVALTAALSTPQANVIPRLPNCGKYQATDNSGNHYYLNHASTWQQFQGTPQARTTCEACGLPTRDAGLRPIDMCACATLVKHEQARPYSPTGELPDDSPEAARAYIRDWCPDHVKHYIASLQARPDGGEAVGEVVGGYRATVGYVANVQLASGYLEVGTKVYTHPAPAPDVARLVEACGYVAPDCNDSDWKEFEEALKPFTAAQQEGDK